MTRPGIELFKKPIHRTRVRMTATRLRDLADTVVKIAAVLVSATLFTLSFPPYELRWLAWFALVPFFVPVRRSSVRQALGLAALWGMTAAYGITAWLPPTIAYYYQQPLWLGMTIFLAAAALMGAGDYMVFAAFYRWYCARTTRLQRRGSTVFPAAAAWVTAELARARLFTGNPWGLLGYTQVGLATTAPSRLWGAERLIAGLPQIADLAGVYGISFVVVSVNLAITEALLAVHARAGYRRIGTDMLLSLGLLAAAATYGKMRVPVVARTEGTTVRVSVIQANLDLGSRWDPRFYGRNLRTYLELTDRTLAMAEPRLVFWPETAMTFFVDDEPAYRRSIAAVLAPADAQLVAGAPRFIHRHAPAYYNSAFLLSPQGQVVDHYDKMHLLPFSEYLPFARFDYIRRSFGRVRSFEAGTTPRLLPTRAGKAGVLICNEAMFPRLASRRTAEGAQLLVNLSNDAWIRDAGFAQQQFSVVSLRAIEQRRYLVRASTSGPSGIVAPSGRMLAKTKPFSRTTASADVVPMTLRTVYSRMGDAFAVGCAAWAAAALLYGLWLSRRGRAR